MTQSFSPKGLMRPLAALLLGLSVSSAQAQERDDLDYTSIHNSALGGMQLPSEEQMRRVQGIELPSDEQINKGQQKRRDDVSRALNEVKRPNSALKPYKGAASSEEREKYGQELSQARGAFVGQLNQAQKQGGGENGLLGQQGVDKLQRLLKEQESAKQALARKMRSGTEAVPEEALLVFVSFSMPKQVLENLSEQARIAGAVVVLRGMVSGQLSTTQERALQVNKAGASWEINPELFTTFDVKTVPAFVLTGNKDVIDNGCAVDLSGQCSPQNTFSKVSGDISVQLALDTIRRRTEIPLIRDLAEKRLRSFSN